MTCGSIHDENYGGHSRHYCTKPAAHTGKHEDDICGLKWEQPKSRLTEHEGQR
jgi:hypothetical protein